MWKDNKLFLSLLVYLENRVFSQHEELSHSLISDEFTPDDDKIRNGRNTTNILVFRR